MGKAPSEFTLTGSRQVMGTVHYMAPEQMRGAHDVDHRADIYSLGVVFYELLTGELPLGKFDPPSRKVQVDVRLDEVVLHALESQPERRYQHVSEVKTDVERVSQQSHSVTVSEADTVAIPPDLEAAILSHLPTDKIGAVKLYRAKTDATLREAVTAIEMIAQKHGIEFPRISLRRRLAIGAIMTGILALYIAGYALLRHYVHLSSVVGGLVYYAVMAVVTGYFVVLAWRYRKYQDTRRYQAFALLAGLFCFAFVIAPLLDLLGEPEPLLNWLYRVSGAQPGEHDVLLFHTLFAILIFGTLAWLIRFWFKLRARSGVSQSSHSDSSNVPRDGDSPQRFARWILLASAVLAGVIFAILRPDISDVMWELWPVLVLAAFLIDVVRYRGQRRGLLAAFVVLFGLTAVLIGFAVQPEPLLNWLYRVRGVAAGHDDPTVLRIILGLIAAWLMWQIVAVCRRLDQPFAWRLVIAGCLGLSAALAAGALAYVRGRAPEPVPAKATVREAALSGAERHTPGLSVVRDEIQLPRGRSAEFSADLWRQGTRAPGGGRPRGRLRAAG